MGLDPAEEFAGAGASAAAMIKDLLPGVVQVQGGGRRGGAGFFWSSDGSVMTNHHVVAGSRKIRTVLTDGRSFDAEVVESSKRLDLAMLKLRDTPAEDLFTPPVGDSEALRVGEMVFAVGHPWGRRGAVTAGIVSGIGTVGRPFGRARYVLSDAYLAPGNSGGPLVNARGEVVGVNAMILGNLALAIPSNTAGAWASGGSGSRRSPRLGVRVRRVELPTSSRKAAGQRAGLVIFTVSPDSPARRAGLLAGDVLLGVAGEPVEEATSLIGALARTVEGTAQGPVRLRLMRGGEIREVGVDLGDPGHLRTRGA